MIEKSISFEQDQFIYLESLMYEVLARKDLLNFVLSKNPDISTELFDKYNTEYIEYYTEYDLAKKEFYKEYIEPILPKKFKRVEWEILFYKNEVKIKIYD